jgi:Family of unknown function (DUF6186)
VLTALWLAMLGVGIGLELWSHAFPGRVRTLSSVVATLWAHPVARVLLLVVWAWVGWHLFDRYGLSK